MARIVTPKTVLVLRHELLTAVRRKSFLLVTLGLPLVAAAIMLIVSLLSGKESGDPSQAVAVQGDSDLRVEGFVDHSGLVEVIHSDVPDGILVRYSDEEGAQHALREGGIAAYYIIPADYMESGDLIVINPEYGPASNRDQTWVMRWTLFANLLGNDPERLDRAAAPMEVQVRAQAPTTPPAEDHMLSFFLPYATMMISLFVIMMSASLLLNSVSDEKKNRVMEVLLLSVKPREILAGKIIGLGILGFAQAVVWVGTAYAILRLGGRSFDLPAGLQPPPSIVAWSLVFILLGYAIYASLMAGLGALVPNLREASQAVIVVIWPMLIPMLCLPVLIEKTHGPLAIVLSIFPLTAPVAMMARLSVGGVPWWQPALAAVLMVVSAVLVVRAVSAMFRTQNLLSGQPFSVRGFVGQLVRPAR